MTSETMSGGRIYPTRRFFRLSARRRTLLVVCTIVFAMLAMTMPARGGAYTPGCQGYTKSWKVKEGGVWIVIGHVNAYIRRCWNSRGWLTSTSSDVDASLTRPGWVSGWYINIHTTHLMGSSRATVWYRTNGDANVCPTFRIHIACGRTEDFGVITRVYAPNQYGPFAPRFQIFCTNAACKLHFE